MSLTGFNRPSLADLQTRAFADLDSRLPGTDSRLRRSILRVVALIQAALAHGLYGFLDWMSRQAMPLYATGENLEAWGAVWAVSRKAATKAAGTVTVTGVNGSILPAGSELRSSDGAASYVTTAAATIASGTATVGVEAINAGATGNQDVGVKLALSNPVTGIDSEATVAAALSGGADTEPDGEPGTFDLNTYRGRILFRIQEPPAGGAVADYVRWTLEVPGVTRAWVAPETPATSQVTIYFAMDGTYANGIPEAADVAAVQAYIEPLRPATAEHIVAAPVAAPVNITIAGLNPDTTAVRTAITAELTDMFARRAAPGGTIRLSWIWEAVSIASGENYHVIAVPSADVTHTAGQLPILGTVTYT